MKTRKVLATLGKWHAEIRDGNVVSITGAFAPQHRDAANGTLLYLNKSEIINGRLHAGDEPIPRNLAFTKGFYAIRLNGKDNLDKFVDWAEIHNLLPEIEQRQILSRLDAAARKAPAFTPLREEEGHALVQNLSWQSIEPGSYSASARNHGYLVAATSDARTAFQAAFHLHQRDYIDDTAYARLNTEIKYYAANPDADIEYRIAVPDSQLRRFETDFPAAGTMEKPNWATQMHTRDNDPTFSPPRKPR